MAFLSGATFLTDSHFKLRPNTVNCTQTLKATIQRAAGVRQVLLAADDELYRALAFHKQADGTDPWAALPSTRATALQTLAQTDVDVASMLRRRHPAL
jgi:hypothetical protein